MLGAALAIEVGPSAGSRPGQSSTPDNMRPWPVKSKGNELKWALAVEAALTIEVGTGPGSGAGKSSEHGSEVEVCKVGRSEAPRVRSTVGPKLWLQPIY